MEKTIFNPAYKGLVNGFREERIRQGLRQDDAAKKLGVSRHWIHKVETSQVRLDVIQFVRLCRVYRVDVSRLLKRLEEELSDEESSFYLLARYDLLLHMQRPPASSICPTRPYNPHL